jgi:hypothetical protein
MRLSLGRAQDDGSWLHSCGVGPPSPAKSSHHNERHTFLGICLTRVTRKSELHRVVDSPRETGKTRSYARNLIDPLASSAGVEDTEVCSGGPT